MASTKASPMPNQTRLERWLDREIARAATPRGAAGVIAAATTVITFAAALLMTVVDHENFPSLGSGLWWAAQTVTTVGYGDDVPHDRQRTAPGRAGDALRNRLPHGRHRGDHKLVHRTLTPGAQTVGCRADGRAAAADRAAARTNRSRAHAVVVAPLLSASS